MKIRYIIASVVALFCVTIVFGAQAPKKEYIWPKGRMPHQQPRQIAAMTDVSKAEGFKAKDWTRPYLEWFEAPEASVDNDACMILISGGAYYSCCDVKLIDLWHRELTARGIQCVNFVYRTPRPEGLPIYQSAWEDGQRAVRVVRSQAKKRGFDPEKIGVIAMSAGSHLALLLGTSSETPAYERVDAVDDLPCHINWVIANAPAYVTTDGEKGTKATRDGYGPDVRLSEVFRFDGKTCPMSLHHGGLDPYSPNGSTLVYRKLRTMGIPSELHLYPGKGHGAFGLDRAIEFMTQMGWLGPVAPQEKLMVRYPSDTARTEYVRKNLWPEGKTPDFRENQCVPYLEWHFPKERKTRAIQVIWSGGSYQGNNPDDFEVAPLRRYLNARGVTVVTVKYRTPRPEGLAKHTSAWQDAQRAIRMVRSEAVSRGLDPERIGIMGSSAGGHLALMAVTSSRHASYLKVDDLEKLPCNVAWGIGIYPAYVLTDGLDGHNAFGGNRDEDVIASEFSFDLSTVPMLFLHGDADVYSTMGSVKVWEKMRSMGIQSELHTLATRGHCFQRSASPATGSYNWMDRVWDFIQPYLQEE